ncbi:glycerophosphodiester phosphodiesterase [Nocardiopsis sp. CNT-189]|uniref:glycerophosphodiester phosphodiesterase family protein n=1 Tax=Nocardiopsis oceanisediminis TaxID=2816862 RepID=UPI003B307815
MRRSATAPKWIALTTGLVSAAALAVPAPAAAEPVRPQGGERAADAPWVIAHRGASAYRPEHTMAAYRLALRQGADVIEPDLVPTSDGHLVARHENELSGTTDVAERPEFADRRTTKVIDGKEVTGWFSEDFTLKELRTLRAVERIPDIRPRNTRYDGKYKVPTWEEVVSFWKKADRHPKYAGVKLIPELKHGAYFDSIGLDTERILADSLAGHGLDGEDSPVIVQSFEPGSAREVDSLVGNPVVQLISPSQPELTTPEGLDGVAGYADAIGPDMRLVLPIGEDGLPGEPTPLVGDAHDRDLLVTPYTLRSENAFLPEGYRKGDDPAAYGDHLSYYTEVLETGVDGVFSDSPDHLREARDRYLEDQG